MSKVTARLRGLWKGYEDLTGHKLDVPLSEDISEAVYSDRRTVTFNKEPQIFSINYEVVPFLLYTRMSVVHDRGSG